MLNCKGLLVAGLLSVSLLIPSIASAAFAGPEQTALPTPLPFPYHPEADATAEIDATLSRAKLSGKRVLIDFGANWCPDCRVFAGAAAMPRARAYIDQHFEVVYVDVGHFDHNMSLPARFGAAKPVGIPTILAVTPDGRLLNRDKVGELSNARTMTPQAIVDWLEQWGGVEEPVRP